MDQDNKLNRARLFGSVATSIAFLALTGPVFAQDEASATVEQSEDEEAVLDVITVTGIRGSIQNSLEAKRNATSIVEVISAEDIGKLPDLSIADSLARLPGVTAQRVRGRAQSVSIRGLGPSFSLALLNGREVVSANNNRGIEFDQFPSELVSQGIVYKTPDAKLAATGIAGAVDLRTTKPLDFGERKINLSAKYVLNDSGQLNPDFEDDGYRLFGSYIDQNADGTIGWYLAVTDQSNPTHFTSRELKTNEGQTEVDAATGIIIPRDNPRTGVVSRDFERTSIAGALQFEPNDRFELTLDAFYNDLADSGIFRGVETPIATWSGGVALDSVTGTPPTGLDTVTFTGVNTFLRTDTESNSAEIYAYGANAAYEVTDKLTLKADLGISELDRNDVDYESYAGTGPSGTGALDTLTYNYDSDGEYSIGHDLDYTDPNQVFLTDPGGWGQVGFVKRPIVKDELTQIRLEAAYELPVNPVFYSVEAGAILSERKKDFDSNEFFLRASPAAFVNGVRPLTDTEIFGSTDSGSIGLDILAYDPARLIRSGVYVVEKATFDAEWSVEEEVDTYFLMGNIDSQIGGIPVRGNLGVQLQETKQTSESRGFMVEHEYDDVLPSLNLGFEVMEDTFVRVGAAQLITRPRMDDMANGINFSFSNLVCQDTDGDQAPDTLDTGAFDLTQDSGSCFYVGGGNPFLEPYRSTSFDLSFERYFDDTTSVAIAVFHKELEDYIIEQGALIDVSTLVTAIYGQAGTDFLTAFPQAGTGRSNTRDNVLEGEIQGIEVTGNLGLDRYLPEHLAGFGLYGTLTMTDSELVDGDGNDIAIPGYSDTTWSANVYYENHGWSARLSGRYRSEFQAEVPLFDGSLVGEQAVEETVLDFKAGYTFEEGRLEGLALNFEVFNLTDEPYRTRGDTGLFSKHEQYGTTYNFTISKSW